MLRLGLTGGIASGKSAVAAMLREMGFASSMPIPWLIGSSSRAIPPTTRSSRNSGRPCSLRVAALTGQNLAPSFSTIAPDSTVSTHRPPSRRRNRLRQFTEWERAGTRDAAFVEAALLIESGIHKTLDGLVVAWCEPEQQLERLVARGLK